MFVLNTTVTSLLIFLVYLTIHFLAELLHKIYRELLFRKTHLIWSHGCVWYDFHRSPFHWGFLEAMTKKITFLPLYISAAGWFYFREKVNTLFMNDIIALQLISREGGLKNICLMHLLGSSCLLQGLCLHLCCTILFCSHGRARVLEIILVCLFEGICVDKISLVNEIRETATDTVILHILDTLP